ncbi:exopolysaccharide biosynthesis protein [Coraliomargarita sp. SDUM461004]|uniref:Exopolysaccharide biosynthesis protein n=1 Tax=Thalassobacterium sedimentorum TaxID=3041258 RepID=A0ABU1AJB2_9BACT|nr:exopolysaccharide biosynthesis protein [Coraliomargarita sp. SDUM461004]MDQ8193851.1 exopolysaccharide biosynthesis protein [Coraliomargarita sp. SDUM461004]
MIIKNSPVSYLSNEPQMQTAEESSQHLSLGDTLKQLLVTDNDNGLSIREITRAVGEKGFGLVLIVLSLPSALPVPAPGYSTPFGIVIALVALQMMRGRAAVWLPRKLASVRIQPALAATMLGSASKFLKAIERFIRPRQLWIRGRAGQAGLASVILIMACLMMLPIPLTNTFPAMVIFMIGVGLSEEDGLLALAAFAVGCGAVLLYAGIIYIALTQGPEAIEHIKEGIKSMLGLGA